MQDLQVEALYSFQGGCTYSSYFLIAVKQLVCTVGHSAVVAPVYPPDKFCDFLYYCNVAVINDTLQGADVQTSWTVFQNKSTSYQDTKAGISFHFRYISAEQLRKASSKLTALTQNNIKHYGVLNVVTVSSKLEQEVDKLKDVFE
ncbi:hypothetical protein V5799_027480, partial [Amblyomma americanum]